VIAVDPNVLVYLLMPGERTEQAERIFRRDAVWVEPLLWRSEFRNVLAAYMRQGLLSIDQALQLMDKAEIIMQGKEYEVSSGHVLSLVAGRPLLCIRRRVRCAGSRSGSVIGHL
jgi:predicted nucleic acid-binding protein